MPTAAAAYALDPVEPPPTARIVPPLDSAESLDDMDLTAVDVKVAPVVESTPPPRSSDVRALKRPPTPPRPAQKPSLPPPLPAAVAPRDLVPIAPLVPAPPVAEVAAAPSAPAPAPSTPPAPEPARTETASVADRIPSPSTIEILPPPKPLRPSRAPSALVYARTGVFFVAYIATALFRWVLAGLTVLAHRARHRLRVEWLRASVRARFPGRR